MERSDDDTSLNKLGYTFWECEERLDTSYCVLLFGRNSSHRWHLDWRIGRKGCCISFSSTTRGLRICHCLLSTVPDQHRPRCLVRPRSDFDAIPPHPRPA